MLGIRMTVSVLSILCCCGAVSADSMTLESLKDNSIVSSGDDRSNGTGSLFVGTSGTQASQRALVFFDVAAGVPAGATIDRASLRLLLERGSEGSEAQDVSVHRLLQDWGEAESFAMGGGGGPAMAGDATWRYRFYPQEDRLWDMPGGDFEAQASATEPTGDTESVITWESSDLAADVQMWLDDPAANYGWILIGNEADLNTARRFSSREAESAENRPQLMIEFTPQAGGDPGMTDGMAGGCGFGSTMALAICLLLAAFPIGTRTLRRR